MGKCDTSLELLKKSDIHRLHGAGPEFRRECKVRPVFPARRLGGGRYSHPEIQAKKIGWSEFH